jgi:hypothetical protein
MGGGYILIQINQIVDRINLVGFEVLTAMVMKSTIFLDKALCSPLKVN